jgi:hypothetical protein
MAEWTIRAVQGTVLERFEFEALRLSAASTFARTWIREQCDEPWQSGKIVLLNDIGQIVEHLPNLNDYEERDSSDDDDF